ncbi:MAG: BamA/TamA family outer membrane protein [Fidelibacterota bacterium]|nr:MAG: BamA/TamA family outer membrane protein [Candidatus Neomarinimicrobiota bacterium]
MSRRLLVLLLWSAWLIAEDGLPVITSVTVEGNQVTKDHIITRELSHPLNQPFDSTLARQDRNRLYNLGIFELVDVYPRQIAEGEATLVVEVVETIRMIPIPIFYHLDQLGWSYGGGVSYLNFRGMNQRLDLIATLGAEKTYTFLFSDPWMMGDRISVTGWVLQAFRSHPVESIRTEVRDFEIGLGKSTPGRTFSISGAVSLERRIVRRLDEQPDTPGDPTVDAPHRIFQPKFSLIWRTTDIWRDPTRGFQFSLTLTPTIGLDDQSPSFSRIYIGAAWFGPIRRGLRPLVLGVGGKISHYTTETPPYLTQYLGGYWVRGYHVNPAKNAPEVREHLQGNSVVATGMELRQTLVPRRLLWNLELGLSAVLFLDAGWGYGPSQPLQQARPLVGYGAGIRLFLPILQVVAFDMGTNRYDSRLRPRLRINQVF